MKRKMFLIDCASLTHQYFKKKAFLIVSQLHLGS